MTMDFGGSDSEAYLTVTATPDKSAWQQVGVPWAYGKGEFDESHFPFLSKTRYPWAATITGAKIKQEQDAPSTARGPTEADLLPLLQRWTHQSMWDLMQRCWDMRQSAAMLLWMITQ